MVLVVIEEMALMVVGLVMVIVMVMVMVKVVMVMLTKCSILNNP